MEWLPAGANHPQKACKERSNAKILLIVFFDRTGIVHREFVDHHMDAVTYLGILRRLRQAVRRRRPALWHAPRPFILHHDNAAPHRALRIRRFLQRTNTPTLPHPAYSPDLAPCDYFLFPRIKKHLKGHRFADLNAVQTATDFILRQIGAFEFADCFHNWAERARKCVLFNGAYFEGMH